MAVSVTTDQSKHAVDCTVGMIGFGMMGQALAEGFLRKHLIKPGMIVAADKYMNFEAIPIIKEFSIKSTTDNVDCVNQADIIILCVKPFYADDVLKELSTAKIHGMEKKIIVSLVSGYSLDRLHSFDLGTKRIIRIMPNTAALVGEASTALSCGPDVPSEDRLRIKNLLGAVGGAWEIPEKRMNIWTAVAGAGPAYVFHFIESLKDSAVAGGIPHNIATEMAIQVVLGAAKMAAGAPDTHIAQLRDNVCSPAGVTICGLQSLKENCFAGNIMKAVDRAKHRYDEVEANPNI